MPPLTQSQLGIYIDSLRHDDRSIYHTPFLSRMPEGTDAQQLAAAVRSVIAAYPSMSARIVSDCDGNPSLADFSASQPLQVDITDMSEEKLAASKDSLVQPFVLDGGPLARISVIQTEKHVYLFTDFHHTVFDGYSRRLMLQEIDKAYRGIEPQAERLTIFEVAREEAEARKSPEYTAAHDKYAEIINSADTTFDIIPDSAGPTEETYEETSFTIDIDSDGYKKYCRNADMPQSVPATAAMGLVLQTYSRKDDVTFATIYHGRKADLHDRTFGMMVKTLPIRISTDADTTTGQLLSVTKDRIKSVRDNDIYSFADAAQEYGVNSDFLFAYQGAFLDTPTVNGGNIEAIPLKKLSTGAKITSSLLLTQGKMTLTIEYRSDLYTPHTISGMASCFESVLSALMHSDSDMAVSHLPLMSAVAQERIISLGQGAPSRADNDATIPMLFKKAASIHGDNTSIVYKDRRLTYRELDALTDALAVMLRDKYNVSSGTTVGVLIERSELMAIYPLAIMKAGGAYMPLDPHFPTDRLMFMIEDAALSLILADDGLAGQTIPQFEGNVISASVLDTLDLTAPESISAAHPGDAMVVLYTSGSTGKPKGVTLEQHNLANYCEAYTSLISLTDKDRVGAYAAFGFDAHMMDLYPTLLNGATVHIFDAEMRLDLTAMHDYIEQEKITVMFMTTQIAWQMATLFDYTTLRVLSCGGEKLPPIGELPYDFNNLYGPTECSVACTAYHVTGPTDGKIIGSPLQGYNLRIVDRYLRPVPQGAPGELLILGQSVGRGYLNRPELTAEKFITIDGEKAYRTGDHVRYTPDGEIEFLGRIDGLVKLRGLRIELGEIEAVATSHPAVKTFVAAVKEFGGMENLVGYYILKDGMSLSPDELRDFMSQSLTEFMVPQVVMQLETMPMTTNGKVDRRALPVPETVTAEIIAPESPMEQKIYDITAEILQHDRFGVTTNLLSVGLTSLMAMRLVASVIKNTGLKLTAKTVMTAPTVREIAASLENASGSTGHDASTSHKRRRYYPLTENQRGVYIDWEMNRDALQYNIPQAFNFGPGTDAEALRDAIYKVLEAHPGLKTRMTLRGGDVMQERRDDDTIEITITDLDEAPTREFMQSRIRPFDLLNDCLFRCEIYRHGHDVYMLRDTHHIIYDGVSAMLFHQDMVKAYGGATLEAETYTALDHALDEKEMLESDEADKAAAWFDKLLDQSEPTSYPRSSQPDNDIAGGMGRIRLTLPSADIKTFCAKGGITVSNYMLSAFLQLLHRLTREQTIQITTVNNGRNDMRLLPDMGMFVKTLPVVSRCSAPTASPLEFARDIQSQFLTSQDYDFYPFTALVETKGVRPDIMYVYEGGINLEGDGDDTLKTEKIPLTLDTAKVPLTVLVFEPSSDEFELSLEYDTSMYSLDDMEVLMEMMRTLSLSLTDAATIADGRMVNAAQEAQLSAMRNGETGEVLYTSFHGAMESHVDATPDAPALIACDKRMTFREFDNECNRIANALIKRGVRRGDRIVILLPRRSCLITGIYGTMKAGATYIPCDPEYPADRIRLITEDSDARFVITTADKVDLYPGKAVDIDELLTETDTTRPDIKVEPEDIAYMIYTSGSTGRPKGVMIPQRAITNYLYGYYKMFYKEHPEIKTQMLLVTISFDASLLNLGGAPTSGHCLVLANEDECKDVVLLSKLMLDNGVDATDITPSRLDAMLDLPEFGRAIARCKHLNIGGEGFQNTLIAKLCSAGFRGRAINEYGPTETTVGCNQAEVTPFEPIIAGRPFYNASERIVDAWGSELPVGAVGELYIFGRGVGLGYNNLPDKTAQAFVTFNGERGYRTGDLARWTPEGDVVILGRIDHQVKLRGLRIELGEIESVASQFEGIKNVAADVREVNKIQHLCLYYTTTAPVDKAKLHDHLASSLTEYMVPDAYTEIEVMPLTPNGKTNRKALPEPEIAPLTPYVEPEGEVEKTIADAFGKILHNDKIGANDDFFAIGGTSISAIKVVAALASSGYSITYKNVFTARTPRALAAMIEGKPADDIAALQPAAPVQSIHVSKFASVLERNTLDSYLNGEMQTLGDVLLTGATGFMGIHMLHELLTTTESRIICLLRRKGDLSAESRLRTLLFYYFDNTFDDDFASGRLSVIEGDVTTPIDEALAQQLDVQTVINCAANVKHFSAGNDIEQVNVESVRNLIDFCMQHDARLVHISTVSIAGESVNGYPDPALLLTEKMMDFGQSVANQYVHSKYEAERLILTAIRDNGLSAKIMRVGNLSARSTDGEFQINFRSNAFMGTLRAYVTLGCAPYAVLDAPCEFSPINEVCKAILLLSSTPAEMTVFQPCNNHRLPLGDVLHILGETGLPVRPIESDEFAACERDAMDDPRKVDALQPLMAYDSEAGARTAFIRYDSSFTNQILYRLGFRWNYTSRDYVGRFIKAIASLNFFES